MNAEKRKAFTLVELLVVISIVAVLLGLLIPALNEARYVARLTMCQSNLRQQGIALANYCTDDRQTAFPSCGRHYAAWIVRLAPYMGYTGHTTLSTQSGHSNSADRVVKGFLCPETMRTRDNPSYIASGHYGYNLTLTNGRPDFTLDHPTGRTAWAKRRTYAQIKASMSRIFIIGDSSLYAPLEWAELGTPNPAANRPRGHKRTYNLMMVDGHVENRSRGVNMNLFWFDGTDPGW